MRSVCPNLFLAVVLFKLSCGVACADEASARRYGIFNDDELINKYFLLATTEVQGCLSLTTQQVQVLKTVFTTPADSIPGVRELRERVRATSGATNVTETESSRIRAENRKIIHQRFHEYASQELRRMLTDSQKARLNQLYRQMRGPRILLESEQESSQIGLNGEQQARMIQIVASYNPILSLLRNRYVELQMNTVRRDRSATNVSQELASVECVMREIEKDEDYQLLATLDADQQSRWLTWIGTSLPINWKAERMLEIPFSDLTRSKNVPTK